MIRMWIAFIVVFGAFYFAINAFRGATGKEKWHICKTLTYSAICAILALTVLIGIVLIF
mgnify:CR=1 FL=1